MNVYITADKIGTQTGGGVVTRNEFSALTACGDRVAMEISDLQFSDVWMADEVACDRVPPCSGSHPVAHLYAGTFGKTVKKLKELGYVVTYTAAAHDIEISKEEHEKAGYAFNLPHLTDPALWARYLEGYLLADVVICPSKRSAEIMRGYGCKRVEVIPHGINMPPKSSVRPYPARFTFGYLGGALPPDKGVVYLLKAWGLLANKDAQLVIAGRDSSQMVEQVRKHCNGNVHLYGFVHDVGDFYNSISVYVQPSATEGFGIEVLEALSYGRPVICSDGAGAADVIMRGVGVVVPARSVERLAHEMGESVKNPHDAQNVCRLAATFYEWSHVEWRYLRLWQKLQAEGAEK